MKKHTKIYLDYFEYAISDYIACEVCNRTAVDIHHIEARGMGGSNTKDVITNLQALCRECHTKMGDKKEYKDFLKEVHNKKLNRK